MFSLVTATGIFTYDVMESDRAETNLGPVAAHVTDAIVDVSAEGPAGAKQPRRRFIGRRAAAERSGGQSTDDHIIEGSGALAGM